MKDHIKNPNLYYIIIPAAAAAWALFTWTIAFPAANEDWEDKEEIYMKSQVAISDILPLDQERLNYEKLKGDIKEFDYATVVDRCTFLAGILSSDYTFSGMQESKGGGKTSKKRKSLNMKINSIGIQKLAIFLDSMLTPWPDLQCDSLKLTKQQKQGPDVWTATLKFTYYY